MKDTLVTAIYKKRQYGYKPGYVPANWWQVLVIYLSDALLRRYSVLPPDNGRAALRCRYT